MKPRVLVTEAIHQAGWDLLAGETVGVAWTGEQAEPLARALEGVQAVIVRVAKLPADVIRGAKGLKIIAKHGVGYDNIDVKAATECGILVTNTPTANSQSVAEHALALLLAVARRVGDVSRDLALKHIQSQKAYQGFELGGKVMGIIGLGGAGLRLARMTGNGLGMRVIGYDPYRQPWPEGVERFQDLNPLLAEADYLSIHVPLTAETRNVIGPAAMSRMKPTSVLVNTARGGIVDEAALAEAIKGGRIGGAGLDVIVDEPLQANHPLAGLPNVILTPHMAGVTEEAMMRMAQNAAEDVVRVLRGERPKYPVNPDVFTRRGM
ncbi:MAG TPA: hydroxyacid dehydrogenase [Candidatus Methylomirabilis sp.]|nr:hydroxyacid dehydrogenase [Candidatus Methylomirabilis sp.]